MNNYCNCMTSMIAVQVLFSLYIQKLPIYNIKISTSLQHTQVLPEHNLITKRFLKIHNAANNSHRIMYTTFFFYTIAVTYQPWYNIHTQ